MNKNCLSCQTQFEITEDDLKFYDKVSPIFAGTKYLIPPPTLCSDCRMKRRLSFINIHNLYKRKNSLTGHDVISPFSSDKNFNVMEMEEWYSDKKKDVSVDINLNKDFMIQFKEVQILSPRWARIAINCENCKWSINISQSKNCYLVISSDRAENCCYCERAVRCSDCFDCTVINDSSMCYEIIDGENLFDVMYSQNVKNCRNSISLYDCDNLSNCLFCVQLKHKSFYVFNEPCSEETFNNIKNSFLTNSDFRLEMIKKFSEFKLNFPSRALIMVNTENCSGNEIYNSKNVQQSFSIKDSEDSKFLDLGSLTKTTYDFSQPDIVEMCYECASCYDMYNCLFCFNCAYLSGCLYCESCINIKNCFGCVGLNRKEYCILNKQYSKEDYERLVPKIIENLIKNLLYGEFFPIENSSYEYKETIAQEYFPSENILEMTNDKLHMTNSFVLPDNIVEVDDSICGEILTCVISGKQYKIIPQELKFYKKMGLPIPRVCPQERHKKRMELRNPRKLFIRQCMKCEKEIKTTYSQKRPEIVYCEKCYLETVY